MSATASYATTAPTREEIDSLTGAAVLEFGTDWCGYCRGAQPLIADAFARHAAQHGNARHIKVEDGPRRPLGRSFHVKLWPTLVFLRDGVEVARVVRPTNVQQLEQAFAALTPDTP